MEGGIDSEYIVIDGVFFGTANKKYHVVKSLIRFLRQFDGYEEQGDCTYTFSSGGIAMIIKINAVGHILVKKIEAGRTYKYVFTKAYDAETEFESFVEWMLFHL